MTPAQAVAIQLALFPRVEREDRLGPVERVAGVDVSCERSGVARAAVAVPDLPDLELVERAVVERPIRFPYLPGLLSFREAEAALARLREPPGLLLCDGHGLAHPRRFGLASHLGLLADLPTIGVAKTLLVGEHGPLPEERGSWQPLIDADEVIGAVLRTRTRVRPVCVSVGHRVSLATAVAWVPRCAPRFRLPETTRLAHRLAG